MDPTPGVLVPRISDRRERVMTVRADEGADAFADGVRARVGIMLSGVARLGVAFSGGVDSSVLLALAARSLGRERVVAILGVSPSLAADERAAAHAVARAFGVPVAEVIAQRGARGAYRADG